MSSSTQSDIFHTVWLPTQSNLTPPSLTLFHPVWLYLTKSDLIAHSLTLFQPSLIWLLVWLSPTTIKQVVSPEATFPLRHSLPIECQVWKYDFPLAAQSDFPPAAQSDFPPAAQSDFSFWVQKLPFRSLCVSQDGPNASQSTNAPEDKKHYRITRIIRVIMIIRVIRNIRVIRVIGVIVIIRVIGIIMIIVY